MNCLLNGLTNYPPLTLQCVCQAEKETDCASSSQLLISTKCTKSQSPQTCPHLKDRDVPRGLSGALTRASKSNCSSYHLTLSHTHIQFWNSFSTPTSCSMFKFNTLRLSCAHSVTQDYYRGQSA